MLASLFMPLVALAISHMAPLPPNEYRHDTYAIIKFVQEPNSPENCGVPIVGRIIACAEVGGPRMIMPNPCAHREESYARVLCHELGHINGWGQGHPDPQAD